MDSIPKEDEFLSWRVDAQRAAIITLAVLSGRPQRFLSTLQELSTHMQEVLLSQPLSEQKLDGMRAETEALAKLLGRALP